MPRTARAAVGGMVYHILNRGNGRMRIFRKPSDYVAFLQLLVDGKLRAKVEVFAFCLMPNHWHLVLRPEDDGDLAAYLSWVSNTHVKRYRAHYPQTSGHLYQGRYKSFPVEEDSHLLTLLRYVESNPLRATLAQRAESWPWSSVGCEASWSAKLLNPCPVDRPQNWSALVNDPLRETDAARIATSIRRDRPLGTDAWTSATASQMGLQHTLNATGRPKLPAASLASTQPLLQRLRRPLKPVLKTVTSTIKTVDVTLPSSSLPSRPPTGRIFAVTEPEPDFEPAEPPAFD